MAQRRIPTDEQQTPPDTQPRPDEWLRREARILDAATALLVRWGYRKTTIDDVAREAGVGKGTIYLHWKDKNALFLAALRREQQHMTEAIKQRIAADPEGGLFHRLIVHSMMAALGNPLMAAVIRGNSDIFNGFVGAYDQSTIDQMTIDYELYMQQLQASGLIRKDIPLPVISTIMSALKVGLINLPDMIGAAHMPAMEQIIDGMSDLIRRWLEPEQLPPTSDVGKQFLSDYLDKV
jgi:AcrR family transcriptional regulator